MKKTGITRRSFGLGALAAAFGGITTGAASGGKKKFLFVHAQGGWDPLVVFAPMFNAPNIEMDATSEPMTVGGFDLVDGPGRPAVKSFFQSWGSRTVVVNGLSTRSVNHETCQVVALTGATSDANADWPTLLALGDADSYHLPHLVLNGPAFPGANTVLVSRAEGRLEDAVKGTIVENSDEPMVAPTDIARSAVDKHLAARADAFAKQRVDSPLSATYQAALGRARGITDIREQFSFPQGFDMRSRADAAIRSLAGGICRCATVSSEFNWDTHATNGDQVLFFQSMFTDLDYILNQLAETETKDGAILADETVVVVYSEMGRTPAFNGANGRDHWPFTTALLIGAGVSGGRAIGGYTDLYGGIGVDPATADLDPERIGVDAAVLGATLLALGGVDPSEHLKKPEVIEGILA